MDKKRLKELLAAYADDLLRDRTGKEDLAELSAEEKEELDALLNVAKRVQSTLKPMTPTREFEKELKSHLLTTAHLRRAEGYVPPDPSRDLLILAIFIGFVLSLTGVLLILKLRRMTHR